MIKDFRHVGIIVTNLDESLKFYRDLLGLKVKSIVNEEAEFLDNVKDEFADPQEIQNHMEVLLILQ